MAAMSTTEEAIRITVPKNLYLLPGAAFTVGATLGFVRGSRNASLRFLAENVHRPPTTVQGWYFYKKTKNYRVMLGALKGAAKEGGRLGAITTGYVALEQGIGGDWKEILAGAGTGLLFGAVNRGIWKQSVWLGLVMGGILKGLDLARGLVDKTDDVE